MKALPKAMAIALLLCHPAASHMAAAGPPARRPVRPTPRKVAPKKPTPSPRARPAVAARSLPRVQAPAPAAAAPSTPAPATETVVASAVEQRILELTNQQRAYAGLPPLARNGKLDAAARGDSAVLASRGILDHVVDGVTPMGRANAAGYSASVLGENILGAYVTYDSPTLADDIVAGWMGSPDHRANLLDPAFTEIGVGVTLAPLSAAERAMWPYPSLRVLRAVQDFARPAS